MGAIAADEPMRPEPAQAKDTQQSSQSDRYTDFIKQVQKRLKAHGFDPGPINGESGGSTQAALALFQLSRALPAGGQLDDQTLAELGVERDTSASAGASAESSTGARPDLPADRSNASSPAGTSSERTAEPKSPGRAEHKAEPETGEKPGR